MPSAPTNHVLLVLDLLLSCPRNSRYIVAIKMGRRLGSVSAYWRIGVWGSKTASRHGCNDQEVSTTLTTLCKRRYADTFPRFACHSALRRAKAGAFAYNQSIGIGTRLPFFSPYQ